MNISLEPLSGADLYLEVLRCLSLIPDYSVKNCLLVDADRTLSVDDTGRLVGQRFLVNEKIKQIFQEFDYCDNAFLAVSKIWSSIPRDLYLDEVLRVAKNVKLRDSWNEIFQEIYSVVPILVVTAGIPDVWKYVLEDAGYANIPIIGGCHGGLDKYIVSARVKGDVVDVLKKLGWSVFAAGDSCVDLPMLAAADVALLVPDVKGSPELRFKISTLLNIRHLAVDEQRFDDIRVCSPSEFVEMMFNKKVLNAS